MTEAAGVYIGLDLGSSGLKGIALDPSGEVVARGRASYRTSRPSAHAAEQAPQDWIGAVEQVAAQLAAGAAPGSWRAIGLSAMIPTLVTAGADGAPVGPAITWEDSRADIQASRLRERCGADDLYRATGQWVDGRYLLPMFLRLAETEPLRAASTASILGAKDYVFGVLTGQVATDPSTAAGFGCYHLATGRWDERALTAAAELARQGEPVSQAELAGWNWPALPPVLQSTATVPLRAQTAAWLGCGRIPVCLGAADSVLGALGLGVRAPGQIAYVAGTSTVVLGVADRPALDPLHRFLVTPLADPDRWGLEMDLLATGSALRWLAGLLNDGLDEAALVALAAGIDPADAPVMLPYFSPGEQGALWDPLLHGTVAGLTFGHGRQHLARGLVNGILLESRRCLAVLDQAGSFGQVIKVAGGSAAEPSFRADLADATGRRVVSPRRQGTDFSAHGAALLAAQAVGDPIPDRDAQAIARACAESDDGSGRAEAEGHCWPPEAEVIDPDSRKAQAWDELWASYERARQAITSHYHDDQSGAENQ